MRMSFLIFFLINQCNTLHNVKHVFDIGDYVNCPSKMLGVFHKKPKVFYFTNTVIYLLLWLK